MSSFLNTTNSTILSYNKFLKKKFSIGYLPSGGRNNIGKVCVHHRGGGDKRKYYFIDFYRRVNEFGRIVKVYKSTFQTAFLGTIIYVNGLISNILLTHHCGVGDLLYGGSLLAKDLKLSVGTALPLSKIKLFSIVSNIELKPFKGITSLRAAGTSAMLSNKMKNKVSLKFSNGLNLSVSNFCLAVIGITSNPLHKNFNYRKAGYRRALGFRPVVRGVAMNPCDHPHGGGEGRKSPLVGAQSPWGWLTKGQPTRKYNKYSLRRQKLKGKSK